MPTTDDTSRTGDDSSRISFGRGWASAARSRPLLAGLRAGLPAPQTPLKKAAAEADHDDFSGLSGAVGCDAPGATSRRSEAWRASRQRFGPCRSASVRQSASPLPGGRVWQCLARARAADAPESRKPAAHSKEWPRVSACMAPAFVSEETPGD